MMNKTLIKPAPTLNSKAPAKGASNTKKIIESTTLPTPMKVIIQIRLFVINTNSDENRKAIKRMAIRKVGLIKESPTSSVRPFGHHFDGY
jgi:hypothetical protein